jgi:4a-hydroxytetrahydrobiopterin dehydratase
MLTPLVAALGDGAWQHRWMAANPADALADDALTAALGELPGWSSSDGAPREIVKEFRFRNYPDTIAFVVALAFTAEKSDHHPDLGVHWGRVVVRWSSHDAGGVTSRDLDAARATDALAAGRTKD